MCSAPMSQDELRRAIVGIQTDATIDESEKAARRQALLTGKWRPGDGDVKPKAAVAVSADATTAAAANAPSAAAPAAPAAPVADGTANANMFDESLKCAICMDLCVRPVTAPCQHNFCLGCFTKWTQQGKRSCPTCRSAFPNRFAENARVNTALVLAIRVAKAGGKPRSLSVAAPPKPQVRLIDKDRPLEAFTTERAQRSGRANAASGRILVTIPADWFGPIPASHCPEPPHAGERGIEVGDTWADRLDCRQYGAHFPHVAGIAGQSHCGAQSVVLSGGYSDDIDEGEYFLYTGSGGRDLSGNKRIAKFQSKHQTFTSSNEALRRSCELGLPVRVVRSHKEKRSAYAPSAADAEAGRGLRYDGVYRIVAAYRRPGAQLSPDGQRFLVCRYVFVRCDNSPAPWSEDAEGGDDPRDRRPDAAGRGWTEDGLPAAALEDMRSAVTLGPGEEAGVTIGGPIGMNGNSLPVVTRPDPNNVHWEFSPAEKKWGWLKPQPASTKGDRNAAPKTADGTIARGGIGAAKALRVKANNAERALAKEFTCKLCSGVLKQPLSMPCGHHFCGPCLEKNFEGVDAAERAAVAAAVAGGRPLRTRRFPKPCPKCKADCATSLEDARPNLAMAEVISKLQESVTAARAKAAEIEKGAKKAKEAAGAGGEGEAAATAAEEEEEEEVEEEEAAEEAEEEAAAAGPSSNAPVAPAAAPAAAAAPTPAAAAPALTAAERAAAAASAALAQLKAELGPELAGTVPDFFLQEALEGHDGNVRSASIEVRMTLQAQARAEKKALKDKEAGKVASPVARAAATAAAAAGPSSPKAPAAAASKGKRQAAPAPVAADAPAAAAADAAGAAPPSKRGRGRPKKQQ